MIGYVAYDSYARSHGAASDKDRSVTNSQSSGSVHHSPDTIDVSSTKSELEKLRKAQDAWNRRNEVTDESGHTDKVRKMWLKPYMVNILSYWPKPC